MAEVGKLLDYLDMVEGFPAVDLSAGANTGDWVSVRDYDRVAVVFISGVGTAGDDPTLTIQQAKDNAGTGAKALNFTTIYRKQAATNLAAVTKWTKTTQSAANTYTNGTAAEESLIWWVEFRGSDLDVANGFDYVRATVADVGTNAQPGYLFYLLGRAAYPNEPDNKLSPL
jgi:hypothetical protein